MSRLFSGTPLDKPPICPICGNAPADCRCVVLPEKKKMSAARATPKSGATGYVLDHTNSDPPKDQIAKVRVEKRKGNREVTVVSGLEHVGNDLAGLLTGLKTALATGGSVQGRTLELQGDHGKKVAAMLNEKGFNARVV